MEFVFGKCDIYTKLHGVKVTYVETSEHVSTDITIGDSKVTSFICDEPLDFEGCDVKAKICVDIDGIGRAVMQRVTWVPANTPILVYANEADTYTVPFY